MIAVTAAQAPNTNVLDQSGSATQPFNVLCICVTSQRDWRAIDLHRTSALVDPPPDDSCVRASPWVRRFAHSNGKQHSGFKGMGTINDLREEIPKRRDAQKIWTDFLLRCEGATPSPLRNVIPFRRAA